MQSKLLHILLFAFFSGIVVSPDTARAGWPWEKKTDQGMKKYSPEWWSYASSLPVGSRQNYRKGKLWPPQPRPTDPQQPYSHQFHAAHFWPHPYNEQDQCIVRVFEEAQIAQGWKKATTLYDYHFDPETQQLTRSGRQQLLWIIQHAHEHRRITYVQLSTERHVNEARLASVKQSLMDMVGNTDSMTVLLDATSPVFRPAHEVDLYQKAWVEGMIPPHIPYSVDGNSSGGE